MRGFLFAGMAFASAGCSLLLTDGLSSDQPTVIVVQGGEGGSASGDAAPGGDGSAAPPPDAAAGTYAAEVLADAPLAYWPLDDLTGSVAKDVTGHGNDGTLADPTLFRWRVPGAGAATGTALRFADWQGLEVGNRFAFPGRTPCAWELWVRPDANHPSWRAIFDKLERTTGPQGGGPYNGTFFYWNPDDQHVQIERWVNGASKQTAGVSPRALPSDRFTHIVASVDGLDIILYVDGVEVGRGPIFADAPATSIVATWGLNFYGDFDELAIYDKALSAARVKAHFDAAKRP